MIYPRSYSQYLLVFTMCANIFQSYDARMLNLALGKPTRQSSTNFNGHSRYAVDGNRNPIFRFGSCMHTSCPSSESWWIVDLEIIHVIVAIAITNRKNSQGRLANFSVEISEEEPSNLPGFPGLTNTSLCAREFGEVSSAARFYYRCLKPIKGRYLRIVKHETMRSALSMCEFEVYGPHPWKFELRDNGKSSGNLIIKSEDILHTISNINSIVECSRKCMMWSGDWQCKHIQINFKSRSCRLMKSGNGDGYSNNNISTTNTNTNNNSNKVNVDDVDNSLNQTDSDWTLYSLVD